MSVLSTLRAVPRLQALARALAASLPLSFRFVEGEATADVAMIDGRQPWVAEALALVQAGNARIVVIDPGDDDPDEIVRLADAIANGSATVILSETFAGNAAIGLLRDQLGGPFSAYALEGLATEAVDGMLLHHVRIARALGIGELVISDTQSTGHSAITTAHGRRGAHELTLRSTVTHSRAMPPRHIVRAYSGDALAKMTIFAADTARPAQLNITRHDGDMTLPTIYETAHRTALREMSGKIACAEALQAFAIDVKLVRGLRTTWQLSGAKR